MNGDSRFLQSAAPAAGGANPVPCVLRAYFSVTPSSGSPIFSTYIETIVSAPASTT